MQKVEKFKMDVVLILLLVLVFLISHLVISKRRRLPPGPWSLPFIGSYFFLKQIEGKPEHIALNEVSQKLGKIFGFRIGSYYVVVLHGYEIIHQALVKQGDVFSDRPLFLPRLRKILRGGKGIIFQNYNHKWKTLRKFTLQTLRDIGVERSSIGEKIMVEVDAACKRIDSSIGCSIEISTILQKMVGNVMQGILFGNRFDFDDPNLEMVCNLSSTAVNSLGNLSLASYLPLWVTWLFLRKEEEKVRLRQQNGARIREFIVKQIKSHENTYDEHSIRDFVDLYIQASRNCKEESEDIFTKENIFRVIIDLFIAGSETTYNTLNWAFLFMAEYQGIQRRCQHEIAESVGDKNIEYADRINLKYIDAVLTEIQRHSNVVPFTIQHCAREDATLMGYQIPKNTILMASLYAANFDSDVWTLPHKFDPDRFLDGDPNLDVREKLTYSRKTTPIPFSVGSRVCLGEPLAREELFLVFANLLQRFRFQREDIDVKHSMSSKPNQVTNAPVSYKLRITRR